MAQYTIGVTTSDNYLLPQYGGVMRGQEEIIKEGADLFRQGRYVEAESVFSRMLGIVDIPDFALYLGLGTTYAALGKHGLAVHFLRHAIDMHGGFSEPWSNLGMALFTLGRNKEALNCYGKALECDPNNSYAMANVAGWFINQGQPQRVIEWGEKAVAADRESPHAHTHLALGLMEAGRFGEAWPHYEHRWDLPERFGHRRPYLAPKWDGRPVKTLAIHGEQGLGDEILFMSCFREAAKRADRVVVECADRLVDLFRHSFGVPCYPDHKSLIAAEGEPDAYVAMGSLPMFVGLPNGKPFLKWSPIERKPKRIGIAWRGGTARTNKRERTLLLDNWAPILNTPGFEFVSVQYGEGQVDEEAERHGVPQILKGRGINESVAAILSCDLIITVCQTAVHLAGGLGVPCWVLTPKKCAWRYCGYPDRMLPWYESVKLYRQDDTEKWEPVIERIANDLRAH